MTDVDAELAAIAAELEGPEPDWDAEPGAPENADAAGQWLRRLASITRSLETLVAERDREVARIDDVYGPRIRRLTGYREWLEHSLQQFMARARAADEKKASIRFPYGVLSSTKRQPKWDFDDGAFVAWASVNAPALVRTPPPADPSPVKDEVKRLVKEGVWLVKDGKLVDGDGVIVPGVTVTAQDYACSVAVN